MNAPLPAVVLVRPSESGNIGAVARAMANTGLADLLIVEPAAAVDDTARRFAVGAASILENVTSFESLTSAVGSFQRIIGTSSQRSRVPKVPVLTPRQLAIRVAEERSLRTALVFGPEQSGLTTEELAACHILVSIPAAARQPTFNLAQAVLIVAYELFLVSARIPESAVPERAAVADVEGLLEHLRGFLDRIGFSRDDTFDSVFRDLRRMALRAELSGREVAILRGVLRRAGYRLALPKQTTSRPDDATAE